MHISACANYCYYKGWTKPMPEGTPCAPGSYCQKGEKCVVSIKVISITFLCVNNNFDGPVQIDCWSKTLTGWVQH